MKGTSLTERENTRVDWIECTYGRSCSSLTLRIGTFAPSGGRTKAMEVGAGERGAADAAASLTEAIAASYKASILFSLSLYTCQLRSVLHYGQLWKLQSIADYTDEKAKQLPEISGKGPSLTNQCCENYTLLNSARASSLKLVQPSILAVMLVWLENHISSHLERAYSGGRRAPWDRNISYRR